jgi:hypothetical protein
MGDFRDLKAWQEAKALAKMSAEGNSRRGPREFRRYLDIARSSLHEVEGVVELVEALGYLDREELRLIRIRRANCARLVYALPSVAVPKQLPSVAVSGVSYTAPPPPSPPAEAASIHRRSRRCASRSSDSLTPSNHPPSD